MAKHGTCRPVIENRKARHDYTIIEKLECGIVLKGNEVKSLSAGMANLRDAWCSVDKGQLVLHGMHISKYDAANAFDVDEKRDRTLLAHKSEIRKLAQKAEQEGFTIIPLSLSWDRQYAKVSVALCKGKHNYDKREALKQKEARRSIERHMKQDAGRSM